MSTRCNHSRPSHLEETTSCLAQNGHIVTMCIVQVKHALPLVREPTRRILRALLCISAYFPGVSCHVLRHGGCDYTRSVNNTPYWTSQPPARPCDSAMYVGSASHFMHDCSKAKAGPPSTCSPRSHSARQASGVAQRALLHEDGATKPANQHDTNPAWTSPWRASADSLASSTPSLAPPPAIQPERLARNQIHTM